MTLNAISTGLHSISGALWMVCAVRAWRVRDPVARRRASARRARA
ncbi:hypothetical protein ABZ016_23910 [Streptomyces sp. NPDC006372]